MGCENYFSRSILEADGKFLLSAADRGFKTDTFLHTLRGPVGETLRVGVAYSGPADAENVLVVVSGTHGVEGYAGAGIQVGVMQNFDHTALPDNVGLLMVHLINPWGVAWVRRENEDNVDLFRNFIYFKHPFPTDSFYEAHEDIIAFRHMDGISYTEIRERTGDFIGNHGRDLFMSLVRRGQNTNPKGVTYHGRTPVWSKAIMDQIAARYLKHARRAVVLDVHTGFGDYGKGIVMCYYPAESDKALHILRWFDDAFIPGSNPIIPHHPASPYDFLEDNHTKLSVIYIPLEFGTYDLNEHLETFLGNNFIHNYGDPCSIRAAAIVERYRELFYPDDYRWRKAVWERGHEVVKHILPILDD